MRRRGSKVVFERLILVSLLALPALSQAAPRLVASEVEAWANTTFERAFSERRFSGLVIAVVQDDAVLFTRGYGYADTARQSPVDPEHTRFRIGSITKTFTAMAIAQLLERGAIHSLDDPVNQYLRRDRLPKVAGKDITLRHLLTHTAGFGSQLSGLATKTTFSLPLSSEEVVKQRPPIVRPPGERSVYSNYGTALLAIVVEDITGQTIEQYFRERIFAPLRMQSTVLNTTPRPSAGLGVPARFLPSGAFQPQPFLGVHPFFAPVGAIESTAGDMARYMMANLQQGRGDSAAVLAPAQFSELHRRMAGNHPASSGFGMIFITLDWNGATFYGHGGDWPGFHSIMLMSPQSNAGFFISCMCESPQPGLLESVFGSARMREDPARKVLAPMTNIGVTSAFLERFWGKRTWPVATEHSDGGKFVGTYWHEYRNYDNAEKFLELLGGPSSTLSIERDGQDRLRINGRGGYGEISPGVFWNAQAEPGIDENFWNSGTWAFTLDSSGTPQHASPTFGIDPYVRAGAFANPRFAGSVLLVCSLFALTGILTAFWPAGSGVGRVAKWLPPLICAALVAFVLVLLAGYPDGDGLATALLLGQSTRLLGAALLANLVALVAATMIVSAVAAWRNGYWGSGGRAVARRVHFTLLSTAAIGLAWVFGFANLLGLQLP
jgi:CubicO group peptidase (beta-lactamase class C family)